MELRAVVYVNWGLWVADCPRPDCLGAEHFGHAPIVGTVGGLTQTGFLCARCGLLCPADWPDNAADIWALLRLRPREETRNWMPGEPLENLVVENVAHGIIPPEQLEQAIVIIDNHLTGPARELLGPAAKAIGA